jgi:hypothetical protein
MTMGYKVNTSKNCVDWVTPREIIEALGPFDLDPCCPPSMPWATARTHFHAGDRDGLAESWFGRVWLNPPYGAAADQWLARLGAHGDGIALGPAATETRRF